jgi:hypothetical protein
MKVACSVASRRHESRNLVFAGLLAVAFGFIGFLRPVCLNGDETPAAAKPRPEFEEDWDVIYIRNVRVGFSRTSVSRKKRDGRELVGTSGEMTLALSRLGQPVKVKTTSQTEETPEGDLIEFRFEMLNPPAAPVRRFGRVEKDTLVLETEMAGKTTTTTIPWDGSIKSPGYQERQFTEHPLKAGEKRSFKAYSPEFGGIATISLAAREPENVKLFDGKQQKLLAVTITQSIVPGVATQAWVDGAGRVLKTSTAMLGLSQVTYRVGKTEALKALSGEEIDLAVASLVKTAAIDRPRETSRVVYRVTIPGEDPAVYLPVGAGQKITAVGPHVADVAVATVIPSAAAAGGDLDRPAKEFLAPNSYIQSDDELVRKHATEAAGDETDPWKAAQLMEKWVAENLKKKNFSTLLASAAEVAKDLSGDCTEHAVLLAAMARARGIASRVAVGLVYAPSLSAFAGHMWTEVNVNGAWVPLDATQGKGHVGADHIKFADSSFADGGEETPLTAFLPLVTVLGKLKIEVREVQHEK